MRLLSIDHLNLVAAIERFVPGAGGSGSSCSAYDSADLLRRTLEIDEQPDPRYWTDYDRFMIEHDARIRRWARVRGRVARAGSALLTALRPASARG